MVAQPFAHAGSDEITQDATLSFHHIVIPLNQLIGEIATNKSGRTDPGSPPEVAV